jgi:hypothetical protein
MLFPFDEQYEFSIDIGIEGKFELEVSFSGPLRLLDIDE